MRRILIVGGGVIGASVAWHVTERGLGEVVLLERDRLGSGTTWHSAGNITWKPVPDSDAPIEYMLELLRRLDRESVQSTGWLRTGRLFIARSDNALRTFEQYAHAAEQRGYGGVLLEPGAVRRHHPLAAPDAIAGAWLDPLSGRLDPAGLVAAHVRGARRRGARIEERFLSSAQRRAELSLPIPASRSARVRRLRDPAASRTGPHSCPDTPHFSLPWRSSTSRSATGC